MSKKVFLGVGHGGKDSGVAANGFKESDLNLKIALYVKSELERHGVIVGISRTTDENDPINEEIKECLSILDLENKLILIKGSHGMHLDEITKYIKENK